MAKVPKRGALPNVVLRPWILHASVKLQPRVAGLPMRAAMPISSHRKKRGQQARKATLVSAKAQLHQQNAAALAVCVELSEQAAVSILK